MATSPKEIVSEAIDRACVAMVLYPLKLECDFFLILLNKRAQDLRLLTVYTKVRNNRAAFQVNLAQKPVGVEEKARFRRTRRRLRGACARDKMSFKYSQIGRMQTYLAGAVSSLFRLLANRQLPFRADEMTGVAVRIAL